MSRLTKIILSSSMLNSKERLYQAQADFPGETCMNDTRIRTAGTIPRHDGACPEWHEDKEGEVWFVREFVGVHALACS